MMPASVSMEAFSELDQGKIWGVASSVSHLKGASVQTNTQGCLPHREGTTAQRQEGDGKVMRVLLSGFAPGRCSVKPQP